MSVHRTIRRSNARKARAARTIYDRHVKSIFDSVRDPEGVLSDLSDMQRAGAILNALETQQPERARRYREAEAAMSACYDCGKVTMPREGDRECYMVHHELWSRYGVGSCCLCVRCLERRLGRELCPADFIDQYTDRSRESALLRERRGLLPTVEAEERRTLERMAISP